MSVKDSIDFVLKGKEECFLLARDAKHAESLRVMAFNYKKQIPSALRETVGIQKVVEENAFFLRIYRKSELELAIWERNEEGVLVPVAASAPDEILRIVELMRKDGKSEEEIAGILKEMEVEE